ncbi:MAG TPA: lipopolysaccharide transport periplasmic protein LptA [Methylibium sp.]|uniref:lipopolysaccharide transport periplasmic protein LptA n=1 Tax=Methylibium sp. TaxID=2067992 RepID=UPI002DBE1A99|nr:lipopolysaccharide transport periplasmic protein LptA [Methylibium sp.]HEU4460369.1 lipopolysaccharide transport periplasmic protein LptA [Methylibium sp.]
MPAFLFRTAAVLAVTLGLAAGEAAAERGDRRQPLAFVADSARVDELKQTNILLGNVEITKGTIVIRADRVEVKQTRDGYQSAIATGSANKRAYFRQKREGSDEVLEGEAERLEYDSRSDVVKLVNNAVLRRFRGNTLADEVAGSLISYDNTTEVFQVVGGDTSAATPGRVRGVLTPREAPKDGPPTPAPEARP